MTGFRALQSLAYTQSDKAKTAYKHIAGDGAVRITAIRMPSEGGADAITSIFGEMKVDLQYEAKAGVGSLEFFILIYADDGECIAASFQSDGGTKIAAGSKTRVVSVTFKNPFSPGRYLVSAGIFDAYRQFHDWVEFAESFEVASGFADGRAFDQRLGRVSLEARWSP